MRAMRAWRVPPAAAPPCKLTRQLANAALQGREEAEALLDRIKSGAIIAVTGRVQAHLGPQQGPSGTPAR